MTRCAVFSAARLNRVPFLGDGSDPPSATTFHEMIGVSFIQSRLSMMTHRLLHFCLVVLLLGSPSFLTSEAASSLRGTSLRETGPEPINIVDKFTQAMLDSTKDKAEEEALVDANAEVPSNEALSEETSHGKVLLSTEALSKEEAALLAEAPSPSEIPAEELPSDRPEGPANDLPPAKLSIADDLLQVWSEMYNLTGEGAPPVVQPPPGWAGTAQSYPFAPHLEDCGWLDKKWRKEEGWRLQGKEPPWLKRDAKEKVSAESRPPWVEGPEEGNLAGTRLMQATIWDLQFPSNCSDPKHKFALQEWSDPHKHGLGSQLHMMEQSFAYAVRAGRIFVPVPKHFRRAAHKECHGVHYGSLSCYFFPIVDPLCAQRAVDVWNATDREQQRQFRGQKNEERCRSNATVVVLSQAPPRYSSYVPPQLKETWNSNPVNVELFGRLLPRSERTVDFSLRSAPKALDDKLLAAMWWRSQASRFFLRRPQPYLCHGTNKVRHQAFGRLVAEKVARIPSDMQFAAGQAAQFSGYEAGLLSPLGVGPGSMEESEEWRSERPFMPRPIVSVHVRQGDKGREMRLFSLASHMWLAERLRRKEPSISNVWLSTEMETVVERSKLYSNWTFFYGEAHRQGQAAEEMTKYEKEMGPQQLIMFSFVNLRIASECDYFVGGLASNWPRLLNELRLTGGKLGAGFMTVNFGEH
eukprot:TRINITY_DN1309_c0_g3_i1.p1 TRINITY_DN1309_c0_g3~~TRINITY_DN1309_c0_g3_i1.p1  ORF type:complete len:693 (-),score=94.18 TRINITY_DN1309_c0_g3_i1:185-2263(-)